MRLAVALMGLALLGATASVSEMGSREERRCSWGATTWRDTEPGQAILAVATDEWWQARRVDLPMYEAHDTLLPAGVILLEPPDSAVYRLQRFRVVESGSEHDLAGGASLWVAPVAGCAPAGPLSEETWIPVGDTVVFILDPLKGGPGPDASPVFEQHTQFGPHPGSGEARERPELSAVEYYAFVQAIPSREALESEPRIALEAFESWVALNGDSTRYPVAPTLADLRRQRQRRPIFWDGHPYLVGCYELGFDAPPPVEATLDRLERVTYLSEFPGGWLPYGETPHFVMRAAPGQVASDFPWLMWTAPDGKLELVWRDEHGLVLAAFPANHRTRPVNFEGTIRVLARDDMGGTDRWPAALTRVTCDPLGR